MDISSSLFFFFFFFGSRPLFGSALAVEGFCVSLVVCLRSHAFFAFNKQIVCFFNRLQFRWL